MKKMHLFKEVTGVPMSLGEMRVSLKYTGVGVLLINSNTLVHISATEQK